MFKSEYDFNEVNTETKLGPFEQCQLENSDFAKSKLSKQEYFKTLKIAPWKYSDLVTSAVYYYLEYSYNKYLNYPKESRPGFIRFDIAAGKIAFIFLDPSLGPYVFKAIQATNLFLKFPESWLYGFTGFIETTNETGNRKILKWETMDGIINSRFSGNFSGFYYYLAAFDFIIHPDVIKYCSQYCIETECILVIFYILQQYKNIFNISLSEDEKLFQNYCLSKNLYEQLSESDKAI